MIDSNGVRVGNVVGTRSVRENTLAQLDVAMVVEGVPFVITIDNDGFHNNPWWNNVQFENDGCVGPAFFRIESASPLPPAGVDTNHVAFVGDVARTTKTWIRSFLYLNGDGCFATTPAFVAVAPTMQVDLKVFTSPFSVR